MKTFTLGDRLVEFAVAIIKISEKLPPIFAGKHLASQLTRSGTAPALHYGGGTRCRIKGGFYP